MKYLHKNCDTCGLHITSGCNSPALKPAGSANPKYIVVGSSVSAPEDADGGIFIGDTGRTFKLKLQAAGLNMEDILFTHAVRCKSKSPLQPKEISLCGEYVRELIEKHEPDGVLMLGDNACKAVFPDAFPQVYSAAKMRGSKVPYFTKSGKVVTCVYTHPPSILQKTLSESVEQSWNDDLASVLEPVSIKVNLDPTVAICKTFPLVRECAEKLKTAAIVAFDFETTALKPYGQKGKDEFLYSVGFAFDDSTCYSIPLYKFYPGNMQHAINELLRGFFYELNPNQIKVGHNTKFDLLWGLYKLGDGLLKKPEGKWEDSSLLCWMSDERPGMSKLKVAAWKYLGAQDWSIDVKDVKSVALDTVLLYNAVDAFYTLRLYQHLEPIQCSSKTGKALYREVLLPAMMQFLKIEMRGVPVNETVRAAFYKKYKETLAETLRTINKESGKVSLNPNSQKQLQEYFVDECGYTLLKRTQTGMSTDNESLEYLASEYSDKVAASVLEFRALSKLQSTYIAGISKHIFDDKRLHAGFNLTATVTGRTSSSDPNMQNFPKRKAREVRSFVVAPEGYKLCSFDYGQIEARLFAVGTGDEKYLDDLYNGYDIHLEKALWLYRDNLGWSEKEATAQRGLIKNRGVFPTFYGAGEENLSKNLKIPHKLAREFKASIFDRYPTIKKWQRELVKEEAEYGVIESLYGRKRRSPMRFNELLNFPNQSAASDMTLTAMNFLGRRFEIALMIHDDLGFFLKNDANLSNNIEYIAEAMLVLPWLFLSRSPKVRAYAPFQIECEVGNNWAEQKKVYSVDSIGAGFPDVDSCLKRAYIIRDELMSEGW